MSKKAQKVQADSGCKGIQGNTSKAELKCVCLNARSIINKKNELDIMVDEIKPHIIGITESWANNDITDAELGLEGYVMFTKDRMGKRGGGVLLYIKETIPAYEVQLHEEADCNEAIWCKLVTGHTTVTIGVVYRCPNITKENNEKIHNAISEVSKGDCIIMGDFNHGNIKWDRSYTTEHKGRRPKVFVPGTGQFLNSTCIRTNQSNKDIIYSAILTERTRRQRRNKRTIGQQRS